jgi:hypothetical protein
MINIGDLYKYTEIIPIMSGTTQIGIIFADYEVREYIDVRNLTSSRSYLVTCKQRFVIPNAAGLATLTNSNLSSFSNYPIMVLSNMTISAGPAGCQIALLDYSPKTVNTSVSTSTANSEASGASTTTSSEQSSGRSTSDTNSYEVSSSVGFFGDLLVGSVGSSQGSSVTNTTFASSSTGSSAGSDRQHTTSGSNSMSIKDWGSYASISDPTSPSWLWAQEYPWDVVQFHQCDTQNNIATATANVSSGTVTSIEVTNAGNGYSTPAPAVILSGGGASIPATAIAVVKDGTVTAINVISGGAGYTSAPTVTIASPPTNAITLPNYVQGRLVDQTAGNVYPPSYLSLFGINFLATAKWIVQAPTTYTSNDETFVVVHGITCVQGTHSVGAQQGGVYTAEATLQSLPSFTSSAGSAIDLVQLALDPIMEEGASNGAVVGFVASQFLALPPTPAGGFRIKSAANNVLVLGSGFSPPANNDLPMSANLSSGPVTFNVYFKVAGSLTNLTLFLKHWISSTTSLCYMSVSINGLPTIARHIDAAENGSGSDNVTTITLRNQDFAAADFYDYLVIGLNVITITITPSYDPSGNPSPGIYSIRALAIG